MYKALHVHARSSETKEGKEAWNLIKWNRSAIVGSLFSFTNQESHLNVRNWQISARST